MARAETGVPRVSVVIPARNEAGHKFEELLRALDAQETDFEFEVIVVDSGSTDGTVALARRYGARVREVPASEFDHGGTRNLGVSLARGEFVALVVGDAVPTDGRWLAAMVENLERDERVAGVYSRQVAHPEASPLTRVLLDSMRVGDPERREQFAEDYDSLPARERRKLAAYDDVSSCLRRSVWEQMPYERTEFGEDLRWGKGAVEAGFKIVYEPRSAVYHSHERGYLYNLRRSYIDQRLLLELFGLALVPGLRTLYLRVRRTYETLYGLLLQDKGASLGAARAASMAARYALVTQIGAFLAVKADGIARRSTRAFTVFDRFMTRGWGAS